jgi:branched-chain amino acid transport system permease protein
VGAAVWIGLEEIVKAYTDYWHLPLGVLLIAIVFLAPHGIAGLLQGRVRKTPAAASVRAEEGAA